MELKPVIAYLRVSTGRQSESEINLEAQKKAIQEWAEKNKVPISNIYEENAAGSAGNQRSELQKAIEQACSEKATLVVHSMSRLSRDVDDIAKIMSQLKNAGADLLSVTE